MFEQIIYRYVYEVNNHKWFTFSRTNNTTFMSKLKNYFHKKN